MIKAAAVLSALSGLGFGVPCVYAIRYLAHRGEIWTFLGFPTYGGGPFERVGMRTTVPLLIAFLVVCVLEVVNAWLLWRGVRAGAVMALVLLPLEFVFWIGFALPAGPVLGVLRTALVVANWTELTAA